MKKFELDYNRYAAMARQAAAEGCVLLKNDNAALPLRSGDQVAVFGRIAFDYYKSGLGSGGLVNTRYVVGILDALKEQTGITLNAPLLNAYESWLEDNPFDHGAGWGQVPWSQEEMPLTDEIVESAEEADAAIVIVGRTAGEDQDSTEDPGSYLLSDVEEDMIAKVCKTFGRVVVILNVGSLVDMKWVDKYNPSAVLYAWHGGQEGGHGVVDVLTGAVNPCGKLTDTIAKDIDDYPSTRNFGDLKRNIYQEDIYVGYRYFETFAKNKVLYPFGFGLSYTDFKMDGQVAEQDGKGITVDVTVTNTGDFAGKEVILIYMKAPQGRLGKPSRVLVGFEKTTVLESGTSESVKLFIPWLDMASFDDSGVTGHPKAFILEEGKYTFFVGGDVRAAEEAFEIDVDETVVEQLEEALAPVLEFERFKPMAGGNTDEHELTYEAVPLRTVSPRERMLADKPEDIPYTGDKGIQLKEVFEGEASIESFVAQLSDHDLIHIFRGEGMCSPKVTPGTASAFGGVTEELRSFGIPVACCADGPSGIRMDCGAKAFSLPNGTALGCTFNYDLVESLYQIVGMELRKNKIDTLLGPGMNIHRNPLNGRNFEYVSEDPLITGRISAAQVAGLADAGVAATIKHFCANNQESGRFTSDSVISERALREIYLKVFEIAVKEGGASSVMTAYNGVNGLWTAGSYDLNTVILRQQWGFDGIVMSDWWAMANDEGQEAVKTNRAPMVSAQNDLFMVVTDSLTNPDNDNVEEKLASGDITRGELQRNTMNILRFIMNSPIMLHTLGRIGQEELDAIQSTEEDDVDISAIHYAGFEHGQEEICLDTADLKIRRNAFEIFNVTFVEAGDYDIELEIQTDLGPLAQLPISIYVDAELRATMTFRGTEGKAVSDKRFLGTFKATARFVRLHFGAEGIRLKKMIIRKTGSIE